MNSRTLSWWQARTLREQRLLLAMFALAAVVLTWLLIVSPLGDALSRARERHGAAVVALADARAQAQAITGAERTPTALPPGTVLDAFLNNAATEAGFPVTRVERTGPNQATLVIGSVRPQAFFGWVARMEERGLIVEALRATANQDQTLGIEVAFRARAGT